MQEAAIRAEIVSVGTELLLGEIANTNAREISERLAGIGVDVMFHVVVGDNLPRMVETISRALSRSQVVVVTGGLGPTHDDLTRDALAQATGRALKTHRGVEDDLRQWFSDMGREMPEVNLRQTLFPEGSEPIPNLMGTAPGIEMEHEGRLIFALPGVPSEMRSMLDDHVIPRLAGPGLWALAVRNLKITGIAEADVADKIRSTVEVLEGPETPKIAIYSSLGEVRIRISKKAHSSHAAYVDIFQVEARLRRVLGNLIYGADADTLESVVGEMAKDKELTVAAAESFTGGLVISRLISVPDASTFVHAGYVTYSIDAKQADLGMDPGLIERHGAVSAETAVAMAEGVRRRAKAKIGLSTTGEAGPDPIEQPVGTMFVGIAWEGGVAFHHHLAGGDRETIRRQGALAALDLFRLWMLDEVEPWSP